MSSGHSSEDRRYMKMALRMAQRGQGHVEPNPMVGAVLVRNGKIIAKGWHRQFGGPHAEIDALSQARARATARSQTAARGATLYVSLEPCCHTGKTGPCTEAIISAGIERVVIAMKDPNPLVAGKGIARLRRAGIQVDIGILEGDARALNRPFIKWITTHQPYVIAKWAQTLDGCIADRHGKSRWISSPPSREFVHQLRGRMDGVITGIGTALADDPLLTARPQKVTARSRTATRIIMDSQCHLPLNSKLVKSAGAVPTMVMHRKALAGAALRRRNELAAHGVQCIGIPAEKTGGIDLAAALKELGKRGLTNVHVEGGPKLIGAMLAKNLIDEGMVFIAPKIAGDLKARRAVEGMTLPSIQDATALTFSKVTTSGPDIMLRWRVEHEKR